MELTCTYAKFRCESVRCPSYLLPHVSRSCKRASSRKICASRYTLRVYKWYSENGVVLLRRTVFAKNRASWERSQNLQKKFGLFQSVSQWMRVECKWWDWEPWKSSFAISHLGATHCSSSRFGYRTTQNETSLIHQLSKGGAPKLLGMHIHLSTW